MQKGEELAWQCMTALSQQNLAEARPGKQDAPGFARSNTSLCLRACSIYVVWLCRLEVGAATVRLNFEGAYCGLTGLRRKERNG